MNSRDRDRAKEFRKAKTARLHQILHPHTTPPVTSAPTPTTPAAIVLPPPTKVAPPAVSNDSVPLHKWAKEHGRCMRTIKRWIQQGIFPTPLKARGCHWISMAEADAALARLLQPSPEPATVTPRKRNAKGRFVTKRLTEGADSGTRDAIQATA
jgi:hypothetical protein